MDSPPYHHHNHYDPTIINGRSLLKPHANQQSTSFNTPPSLSSQYISPPSIHFINTHIPPAPTYPKLIANNSHHYLTHHINSAIQELHRSQQACIQAISNLATDISTLNQSLTPPNYTHRFPTSLAPFISQQPLKSSNTSPSNFTYQQPIITPTPVTNQNFQHYQNPFSSPEPTTLIHHPNPPHNSNHVTIEINSAKKVVPNFTPHSDPISHVVDEHPVFVDNVVAPSNLVLDSNMTFSTKTDERSRDDVVTVKGHEEEIRQVLPSISQSPCDSNRSASLTIKACGDVSMGLAPVKINVSLGSRPSPPPYKLTGTTSNGFNPPVKINVPMSLVSAKHRSINTNLPSPENEVVHDVTVADAPLQPPLSIFMLTGDSIQIFDPGGTLTTIVDSIAHHRQIQSLSSVAFNFHSSGIISFISGPRSFSLLWLPRDRGKKSCSEAVLSLQS
jgi:hypothetical protein